MTHPLRASLTRGHCWGAADSVTESAAPHQCPLGSVASYLICADVRTTPYGYETRLNTVFLPSACRLVRARVFVI